MLAIVSKVGLAAVGGEFKSSSSQQNRNYACESYLPGNFVFAFSWGQVCMHISSTRTHCLMQN